MPQTVSMAKKREYLHFHFNLEMWGRWDLGMGKEKAEGWKEETGEIGYLVIFT